MEHRGVRLARAEFSRATTQTAILMAEIMGCADGNAQTIRGQAAEYMLGVLRSSILDINVVHADDRNATKVTDAAEAFEAWRQSPLRIAQRRTLDEIGEMSLDCVLSPVDGATSLSQGRSGTTSVIAGGPPNTFVNRVAFRDGNQSSPMARGVRPSDSYLTIVLGENALSPIMAANLDTWEATLPGRLASISRVPLRNYVATFPLLSLIIDRLDREHRNPVIGITLEGSNCKSWTPELSRRCRRRTLEGSALVAGLAPHLGHVDIGFAVSRTPQTIQMALAAKALGGRLYAIPLDTKPGVTIDGVHVPEGSVLRRESDFVPGTNGLLCMTSVTEICIQDRVRGVPPDRVSTETITISLASRGLTSSTQEFDMAHATFRNKEGAAMRAIDLLAEMSPPPAHAQPAAGNV